MKKTFKCMIKIVSPVHIGCDEVYEPTGFVVDQDNSELIHFDPSWFIANLEEQEREKLSSICLQGDLPSILKLYKFFQNRKADGQQVKITSDFIRHYNNTLKIPENNFKRIQQDLNNFTIQRTAFRTWDSRAYLPGSSVKGAMRTGYLNYLCNGRKINVQRGKEKLIENKLLNYNQIDEDPFSRVKISDFQPVGDVKTKIVYAVNKKKIPSDKEARGPYQILEIIEPGSIFKGYITVDEDKPHPENPVKKPIELVTLLTGTNDFFTKENAREKRELNKINILMPDMDGSKENNLWLRIGRHSGAESVTIKGNRDIKIMQGRPPYQDHATTLWLASPKRKENNSSALSPFGWSYITYLTSDYEQELTILEKEYQESVVEQENKTEKSLQQQSLEETQKKQREENRQKQLELEKLEQERKKAALKEMSPEERMLAEIFDSGEIVENSVVELFNKLDDMEESFKLKSAAKIKDYYIQQGKWKVNKKQKKQFAKVSKLKSILGE